MKLWRPPDLAEAISDGRSHRPNEPMADRRLNLSVQFSNISAALFGFPKAHDKFCWNEHIWHHKNV
jgi:hypothetical protein